MPYAAAFLICALALLSDRRQREARAWFQAEPRRLWIAPLAMAVALSSAAAWYGVLSLPLLAMIAAYALAPAVCVFAAGAPRHAGAESCARWLDLAAVAMLWLPLEFAAGATMVARPVQGALHAAAYGASILLALAFFLLFRAVAGMKYRLPAGGDYRNAAIGFAISAAALIPLGLWTGFLDPPHAPPYRAASVLLRIVFIFFGTAFPEELLFRSLIQNFLAQRWGDSNTSVAVAAVIFGLAHLNNGPQAAPNWRYAVVACAAGFIFGKVFQRSSSVFASAFVHTGVNSVKWLFF